MHEEPKAVTRAADIALPMCDVELQHLFTKDGQRVVVRCELVDELVLVEHTKQMAGDQVKQPDDASAKVDPIAYTREMMKVAPMILAAGTALMGEDGQLVRPAFFVGNEPPHPHAIPFRLLRVADVDRMMNAILRLGRYGGGAAEDGGFSDDGPGGDGAGSGDGGRGKAPGNGAAGVAASKRRSRIRR